jgi:hypothetical protein
MSGSLGKQQVHGTVTDENSDGPLVAKQHINVYQEGLAELRRGN